MNERQILSLLHETLMQYAADWAKSGSGIDFEKGIVAGIMRSWHVVAIRVDLSMAKEGYEEYQAMLWDCTDE